MCGIFGVLAAGSAGRTHEDFILDGFVTGQVRGMHGTGLMTVARDGYVRNKALALPATAFLKDRRARSVLSSIIGARVVVGHNRFTTSGRNVDEHCHPFRYKHVCGVHNGGVGDHILDKLDTDNSHDVDSGRIFAALDAADDPLDVLKEIHAGAYCLVWTDSRTKALYFARNHSRPMHVAETLSGMYFASELGMLTWLLARNSVTKAKEIPIAKLDTHTLYEIPLADPASMKATKYEVNYPITAQQQQPAANQRPANTAPAGGPSHPYYQGPGVYGGEPAPVAFKRYLSPKGLLKDFPCVKPFVDIMDSIALTEETGSELPFVILGMATDVIGDPCAYGLLCTEDGKQQFMGLPVACRLRNANETQLVSAMLTGGYNVNPKERRFPIAPVQCSAMLLRPTGELVINGTFPFDYADDDGIKEIGWIPNIDRTVAPWVQLCVGSSCLINQTPDQLSQMWISLKQGKTPINIDDDIPF